MRIVSSKVEPSGLSKVNVIVIPANDGLMEPGIVFKVSLLKS